MAYISKLHTPIAVDVCVGQYAQRLHKTVVLAVDVLGNYLHPGGSVVLSKKALVSLLYI